MQEIIRELNVLIAVSKYTQVMLVLSIFGVLLLAIVLLIAICMLGFAIVVVIRKKHWRGGGRRKNLLVVCCILLASLIICPLGVMWQRSAAQTQYLTASKNISESGNLYAQLNAANWDTLDEVQRLALLQVAAQAEAEVLGVHRSITVLAKEIENTPDSDVTIRGYLSSGSGTIVINSTLLAPGAGDSGYDCLEVVVHEVYHVYQQELIAMYYTLDVDTQQLAIFDTVRIYIEEYASGYEGSVQSETYAAYISQRIEIDAYIYAATQTTVYKQSALDDLETCAQE